MISRRDLLAGAAAWLLPSINEMRGPVLVPDRPWEGTAAFPFSGGVWKLGASWRCYYVANFNRVCLAFSDDGLTWTKPDLGIVPGTNILLELDSMDSCSVVLHLGRWYMTISERSGGPLRLLTSRNGLWWTQVTEMTWAGDRTTLWWNPAKERWTFNVRNGGGTGGDPRRIDRVESETFIPKTWEPKEWLRADEQDGPGDGGPAQLYALDVVPQGDRLVGLFTIWRGAEENRPKLNDVCLGFSKDGDTWQRSYTPILTRGEKGAWNYGNVQSVGNGLIQINGTTRLYATGRSGIPSGNGQCAMGYKEVETL